MIRLSAPSAIPLLDRAVHLDQNLVEVRLCRNEALVRGARLKASYSRFIAGLQLLGGLISSAQRGLYLSFETLQLRPQFSQLPIIGRTRDRLLERLVFFGLGKSLPEIPSPSPSLASSTPL